MALAQQQLTISKRSNAGIAEIVLPQAEQGPELGMVLPMLAHLSNECADKWFTWIAPKHVSKAILEAQGFDTRRIRLIHTNDDMETLWVFWEALSNGNSGVVVANLEFLFEKDRRKLESASINGSTRGLVLRARR